MFVCLIACRNASALLGELNSKPQIRSDTICFTAQCHAHQQRFIPCLNSKQYKNVKQLRRQNMQQCEHLVTVCSCRAAAGSFVCSKPASRRHLAGVQVVHHETSLSNSSFLAQGYLFASSSCNMCRPAMLTWRMLLMAGCSAC